MANKSYFSDQVNPLDTKPNFALADPYKVTKQEQPPTFLQSDQDYLVKTKVIDQPDPEQIRDYKKKKYEEKVAAVENGDANDAETLSAKDFLAAHESIRKKLSAIGLSYDEYESDFYIDSGDNEWSSFNAVSSTLNTNLYKTYSKSLNGIFGCPYQFSNTVDMDIKDNDGNDSVHLGRKYVEKILTNAPLLFLSVGSPEFLAGSSSTKKKNIAKDMIGMFDGGATADTIDQDNYKSGRFYSFVPDMVEYQAYFNTAARSLAILMGIGDRKLHGTGVKLSNIRLDDLYDNNFRKGFGAMYSIPFFVEAETSISESFSNGTTQSILEGAVEQPSQVARQAQFLLGTHDIGGLAGSLKSVGENLVNSISDVGSNLLEGFGSVIAGNGLVNKLKNEFTTIASGGKMIFPEVWDSSNFSRSYSITMKLRSPDPDPYSIFMNIYVPILLWVTAAAPHQMNNSATSYTSPFIIRATYKSVFACDAGIVSNISITKASEDKWNAMGMPVSVDLNVDIKDLYSTMFISKAQGIINNTAQLDYLALMAGVDMNDVDARRSMRILASIYKNKPLDIGKNFIAGAQQSLNNKTRGLLRTIGAKI